MAGAMAADGGNGERVGSSVEQRREQTRTQILEAAAIALTRDGYEKITTRRIAEEAGVNSAILHYYFGTKEALLSEAIRYALGQNEARLRAAINNALTAPEALAAAFQEVWAIVQERPGILRYDVAVRALREEEARREAHAIYGTLRQLVEEILKRHFAAGGTLAGELTAYQFAYYVVSAVDGIVLQHAIMGDNDATRCSLELIRQHSLTLMNSSAATQGGQNVNGKGAESNRHE